jgi:hypothetical protein
MKGSKYGSDIEEALKNFEESLGSFRSQAMICDSQRLGRIEGLVQGENATSALNDVP